MALSKAERAAIEEIKSSAQVTTKLCNQLLGPRKPQSQPSVTVTQGKKSDPRYEGQYGSILKRADEAYAAGDKAEGDTLSAEYRRKLGSGKRTDTLG